MPQDNVVYGNEFNAKMSYSTTGLLKPSELNNIGKSLNLITGKNKANINRGSDGGIQIQADDFPWHKFPLGFKIGEKDATGQMDYSKIFINYGTIEVYAGLHWIAAIRAKNSDQSYNLSYQGEGKYSYFCLVFDFELLEEVEGFTPIEYSARIELIESTPEIFFETVDKFYNNKKYIPLYSFYVTQQYGKKYATLNDVFRMPGDQQENGYAILQQVLNVEYNTSEFPNQLAMTRTKVWSMLYAEDGVNSEIVKEVITTAEPCP